MEEQDRGKGKEPELPIQSKSDRNATKMPITTSFEVLGNVSFMSHGSQEDENGDEIC